MSISLEDTPIDSSKVRPPTPIKSFVKYTAFIATLGGLIFGYDTGIMAGALIFMKHDLHLTPSMTGLVTGILVLGAAVGAMCAGKFADVIGRKKIILILAAIFIFGSIGSSQSPDTEWMIFFRLILGCAVGAAAAIVPIYIAEIVPSTHRGRFVALQELMIVTGQLLAYTSSATINEIWGGEHTWRVMLSLSSIPAVFLLLGMIFLPDTPRWYAMRGRFNEAKEVLKLTRHKEYINKEFDEIHHAVKSQQKNKGKLSKWMKRLIIVGVGIAMVQQLSGINAIMYYAPMMLESSGMGAQSALLASLANGIISVVMTLIGIWMLGKVGRKTLMLTGQIGCVLSLLFIAAACYYLPEMTNGTPDMLRASCLIIGMLVFLCFQQSALSPVAWLLISEIFPLHMRGLGTGISVFGMWLTTFLISTTFPMLLAHFGLGLTFLIFALCGTAGVIFVALFAPETRGKSLEELEKHLQKKFS